MSNTAVDWKRASHFQAFRSRSPLRVIDANVIQFQCPSCGFELQTIGLLKAEQRMVCAGCNVAINIDSVRLVVAAEALQGAQQRTGGPASNLWKTGCWCTSGSASRASSGPSGAAGAS